MRHYFPFIPLFAVAAIATTACDGKPEVEGTVTFHGTDEMTLPAAQTDTIISFSATAAWTVQIENGDWLTLDPDGGADGDFEAVLYATANSDTDSRTAILTFLCGTSETTLTVTQEGTAGDEPEEPVVPDTETALIRTMTISEGDGDDTYQYTFTYDGDARLTLMEGNYTFYESYEEIIETYCYGIEYSGESIVISGKGGDGESTFTERIDAALDENGRAVSMEYTSIEDDGYGYTDETEVRVSFSYDASGRLLKENGTEYGYQDFYTDFTWTGGDLTGSYNSSESYETEYMYSEHANTGNIDLNWILSGGYSSWSSPLGIIGVLGERSEHYTWPDIWDYAILDENIGVDGPVHQDLIGTTIERSHTRYSSGEPEVIYDFTSVPGYEEEVLSSIVKSVPQYRISYKQTYEYVLEDSSIQPDEDGYYYYGVRLKPVGEPVETDRETLDPEVTEVHIGY